MRGFLVRNALDAWEMQPLFQGKIYRNEGGNHRSAWGVETAYWDCPNK